MLRDGRLEAGEELGTVIIQEAVRGRAAVVPAKLKRSAGHESLVVGKVVRIGVGKRTRLENRGLRGLGTFQLDRPSDHRIAIFRQRAGAGGREYLASKSGRGAAGAARRAARAAASRQRRTAAAQS